MNEAAENLVKAFGVGIASGLSANGYMNLFFPIMDKVFDYPNSIVSNDPNITNSELLEKFAESTETSFITTMVFTFVGLTLATAFYALVIKPVWQTRSNMQEIRDPNTTGTTNLTTSQHVLRILKVGSLSASGGAAIFGAIEFLKNILLRNYPKDYAEKFTTVASILEEWSGQIGFDLLVGCILIGAGLLATPLFAGKNMSALFWRTTPENRPLVTDSAPSSDVALPTKIPSLSANYEEL